MKRSYIAGIGAIALVAIPFANQMPVLANLSEAGQAIAQNFQRKPQVQLNLTADQKVVQQDKEGKPQVTWKALKGNVVVQPGDVIRYTVNGENKSDEKVNNLVVTQPIPARTRYVLNSVTANNNGTKITYSIDKGKSFVEKPTVQVKLANGKIETRPAPAEIYTHVRWKFAQSISPKAAVNGTYQVEVR